MDILADWTPAVIGWGMVAVVVGVAVALRRNRPRIALALVAVFMIVLTVGFIVNLTAEDASSSAPARSQHS
jgi:amino acid transporter